MNDDTSQGSEDTRQGSKAVGGTRPSRRGLILKGTAGVAAAGLAWTAPRIEGLSLRPDYAAAQSAAGASFDLTLGASGHANITNGVNVASPAPGLDQANLIFNLVASALDQDAFWAGEIRGSAAANNCTITGLDGSQNWADLSPSPPFGASPLFASGAGVQVAARNATGSLSNSGSTTVTMHVTCT